jgi:hypothetical protein
MICDAWGARGAWLPISFFQIAGRSKSIAITLAPNASRVMSGPIAEEAPRSTTYCVYCVCIVFYVFMRDGERRVSVSGFMSATVGTWVKWRGEENMLLGMCDML